MNVKITWQNMRDFFPCTDSITSEIRQTSFPSRLLEDRKLLSSRNSVPNAFHEDLIRPQQELIYFVYDTADAFYRSALLPPIPFLSDPPSPPLSFSSYFTVVCPSSNFLVKPLSFVGCVLLNFFRIF